MNFIDKAFADKLAGDDFLQAMADIYKEPEVRKVLHQYPRFISDVITIIDYNTALQMDGLDDISHTDEDRYDEKYDELNSQIALYNDYEGFWDLVREYINLNLA